MGKLKKISVSLLFLILSTYSFSSHRNNNLTITKDIEFEIEIKSSMSLDLDSTVLDFGNLVRDNKDTVTRTNYLKFKKSFDGDRKISVKFNESQSNNQDINYEKFTIDHEKKAENSASNGEIETLDVYIKKVNDFYLKKGEVKIPITGEIREVPKNARLGKYEKTIKATVYDTVIDPTKVLKGKQGGM